MVPLVYRNKTHLSYTSRFERAMKKCSLRSIAEESAEEEANVQRKEKKISKEEKGKGKEEGRPEQRRAPCISRNTVATPKVYHSGAQSVGCSWDVRAPCRNTMETVG